MRLVWLILSVLFSSKKTKRRKIKPTKAQAIPEKKADKRPLELTPQFYIEKYAKLHKQISDLGDEAGILNSNREFDKAFRIFEEAVKIAPPWCQIEPYLKYEEVDWCETTGGGSRRYNQNIDYVCWGAWGCSDFLENYTDTDLNNLFKLIKNKSPETYDRIQLTLEQNEQDVWESEYGYKLFDRAMETIRDIPIEDMTETKRDEVLHLLVEANKKQMSPNTKATAHRYIGEIFLVKGDFTGALNEFKTAVELDPKIGLKRRVIAMEKELLKV